MKPAKGQQPSNFIQKLKEEAVDAKIEELREASLILHLTTAGRAPNDVNKKVKQIILEELRVNPNQKDLRKIMERIRGVEADHNAEGNNKSNIRKVGEFKCKTCKKTHSRGECNYVCTICKKKGHPEDRCWQREDTERGRRDNKERGFKDKTKSSKRKKGVRLVNQSGTETDAESSAPSDSEAEVAEQPERSISRKIGRKTILNTPIRSVRKTKKISDEQSPDSVSDCLDISAALAGSGYCKNQSTYESEDLSEESDEERAEKILQAYKKRFSVRRIRSDRGASARIVKANNSRRHSRQWHRRANQSD